MQYKKTASKKYCFMLIISFSVLCGCSYTKELVRSTECVCENTKSETSSTYEYETVNETDIQIVEDTDNKEKYYKYAELEQTIRRITERTAP